MGGFRELLVGAGSSRIKKVVPFGRADWSNLTTLDINADHHPDVVWNLEELPLPFENDFFDEVHAYEVLEHTGQQGDFKFFFAQFSDFWRILKPGGVLVGSCPCRNSVWAWGDPSHRRIIQPATFVFLDQTEYTRQVGKTSMSDFRFVYKADFERVQLIEENDVFYFLLRAVKPSRITLPEGKDNV